MHLSLSLPPARAVTRLVSLASMALGALVMLGWHLRLSAIVQIHPGSVPMQYNAALGFLLAGIGLSRARSPSGAVTVLTGTAVALIGSLTLAQHLFAVNLGLDQLFMRHYITVATSAPGRMAPNTALCFMFSGLALVLSARARRQAWLWQPVGLMSAMVVGLGVVAFIGYLIGIPTAYGWGNLTRMAAHTAVGFQVLGLGLIALSWQAEMGSHDWRPWAIGMVTTTITVTLWQALKSAAGSAEPAADLMLAFGLLMALALANSVADSLKLRRAAAATERAFARLGEEMAERQKAEEQVRQLAFYDPLTRLPNRRLLQERLGQAMAASKRRGHFGAVMFIDLDNFKPLNDTHGHAVGDLLLVDVAARLKSCVRETDTVARLGGDEFTVVLNELAVQQDVSIAQAQQVAHKILAALSQPYQLTVSPDGQAPASIAYRCTASIGIALFFNSQASQASQDDIMRRADAAMYQAKDLGRNAIRMHQADEPLTAA